ncbi:glycosyltransferase [Georgenia sp. Z1344]|uniref:glycosyltransferase n=1 Tax=Georgenia sp. Z1344 TaxID=3416706 RepID=UPI003CEEF7E2
MRPHLLYVAWGFPPCRGSGVYRALATANAFAEAGWDVTVLTAPRELFTELFGADLSLERRVHPAIEVLRVKQELAHIETDLAGYSRARVASEPGWFSAFMRSSELSFPERVYGGWAANLRAAAEQVHERHPVDLVLGTSNPHVDFVPGQHLARRADVPYVLDYRDGWALDVTTGRRVSGERSRAWRTERELLLGAEEAWFVNAPIRDWYDETLPEVADRTHVVANGYDGDLGEAIDSLRPTSAPDDDAPLTFGYLGTLYGSVPVRELLEGWRAARARSADLARARLVLRGHVGHQGAPEERTLAMLAEFAGDGVEHGGPVPRAEVASVYAGFDVLALPLIPGRYVTSGKVFEYAATGLPVVSVHGPESAASSVLDGHPAWVLTESMSADDVADALVAGAALARSATAGSVAETREWARRYAREEQLAPRVAELGEFVARRAAELGLPVPEVRAHEHPHDDEPPAAEPAGSVPALGGGADTSAGDDAPRRFVLVVGSEDPADEVLARSAGAGDLAERLGSPGAPAHVTLVCRTAPVAPVAGVDVVHVIAEDHGPLARIAGSGRYRSFDAATRRSVPGRLLATLSPVDDTRTVWRAARADATAESLAGQADVAVAVDLPAVRTAWEWLRRGVVGRAVHGVAAAERLARREESAAGAGSSGSRG